MPGREVSSLTMGVVGTLSRLGRGCREGVEKLGAKRQLLTHLGLQHLQALRQLRHFAAIETTCGREEAGAGARDPRFPWSPWAGRRERTNI